MDGWSELLDHLTQTPRENGTSALDATASWLVDALTNIGLQVQTVEWTAHPWRLRIVGVGAFLASVAYVVLLQRKNGWGALAVGLLVPLWIVVELDVGVPLLGWIHPSPQKHVVALVAPTDAPRQRLVFSAHYDTKTDLLDHVERAPFTFLGLPLAALLVVVAAVSLRWKLPRLVRVAQVAALVNGVGQLVVQAGGAVASQRSPGAIDDGASCAILLQLGRALHEAPLTHTEVEFVFFSGEEIGIEGSRAYARERFGGGVDRPTRVVNLDGVGARSQLLVMKSETSLVRSFSPDPRLLALVGKVHQARYGAPLYRTFYSASTDARAFLEVGIPALTLASDLPDHAIQRGLHSTHDARELVRVDALDATVALLSDVARAVDAEPAP